MNENESIYVFDTSAWLALIEDEAGAETVQNVLERAASDNAKILVSAYIEMVGSKYGRFKRI